MSRLKNTNQRPAGSIMDTRCFYISGLAIQINDGRFFDRIPILVSPMLPLHTRLHLLCYAVCVRRIRSTTVIRIVASIRTGMARKRLASPLMHKSRNLTGIWRRIQ